jgi:pyruvate dehydrogenase E1 component alpha subunit
MEFTQKELLETYEKMSFCRRYEIMYEEGALSGAIPGFQHLALGEESILAAELTERGPNDWLFPNSTRNLSLNAAIFGPRKWTAEAFGRVDGVNKGLAGAGHLYSKEHRYGPCMAILGAENGVATGIALAMKMKKVDGCCIMTIGDGTINEGLVSESLNMVAIWKLPFVLLIRNNQYGMGMSFQRHSAVGTLAKRLDGFGVPCETLDGIDALAVKSALRKAIAYARAGQPCGLEVNTVRWTGHFVGDPQRYRDAKDKASARDFDPLKKYREYLLENQLFTKETLDGIDAKNDEISHDALEYAATCGKKTKEFICVENAKNLYA